MPETNETPLTALADAAFRLAAETAILKARQTGTPLIVWEGDGPRAISPDEAARQLAEATALIDPRGAGPAEEPFSIDPLCEVEDCPGVGR